MAAFSDNNKHTIVDLFTITDVVPERWVVIGRNSYGNKEDIRVPLNPIIQIPDIGDVWTAKRVGVNWELEKKIKPILSANYEPGDTILGNTSVREISSLSAAVPGEVKNGTDLNNYITPGWYLSAETPTDLVNSPTGATGFVLRVEPTPSGLVQTITTSEGNQHQRVHTSSGWGSWDGVWHPVTAHNQYWQSNSLRVMRRGSQILLEGLLARSNWESISAGTNFGTVATLPAAEFFPASVKIFLISSELAGAAVVRGRPLGLDVWADGSITLANPGGTAVSAGRAAGLTWTNN